MRTAFLLLPLALLTACDRGGDWYGRTTPKYGTHEIRFASIEPEWIDPGKCADNPGGTIISGTFEGLVQPNAHTLAPEPAIAKSWDVSDDKRTYVFHLRDDARWSDGVPVTSQDFLYSWKRVLDPKTDSKYSDQFFDILNGEPMNRRALHVTGMPFDAKTIAAAFARFGKVEKVTPNESQKFGGGAFVYLAEDDARTKALAASWPAGVTVTRAGGEVLGLEAPDDHTFVVTLAYPVSYFLPKITTLYTFYPVPRHVIERLEKAGQNPDLWTRVENFVGNGAFVLREWKFRQSMTFERNPYYWDRANVKLDRIIILEVESYTTILQLYKAGELDWIGENADVPSEYAEYLRTKKDYRVSPYLGVYWYWFNTKDPAVKDPRVRHALDMALDKQAIVDHVTKQNQPPAWSVVPEGLGGFHTKSANRYDVEGAKKLLAEAGITNPSKFSVTLTYNTSETHKAIAEAMQEMWRKNLGIDAKIHNEEWSVFNHDLETGNLQMGRLGWIGDYPDPFTFLSLFQATSGNNHANWANPEFERAMADSLVQTDNAKRIEKLELADRIIDDDMPVLPIYFYTRHYIAKGYVKGLYNTFQDRHPWKALWIDPDAVARGDTENGN